MPFVLFWQQYRCDKLGLVDYILDAWLEKVQQPHQEDGLRPALSTEVVSERGALPRLMPIIDPPLHETVMALSSSLSSWLIHQHIYIQTSIFYIVLCCRTIEFPQFGLNKGLSYLFHWTGKFFKYLQGPRILYSSAKWLHVCNGLQKTQLWNAVSNTREGLTWKGTWPRRCSGWAQMVCF